jgi:hypothetical protein
MSILVGLIDCEFDAADELRSLVTGQQVTVRGKCENRGVLRHCQAKK